MVEGEGASLGVAQLSWEEYKNQRQVAREERKGGEGGILSGVGLGGKGGLNPVGLLALNFLFSIFDILVE